MRKLSAQLFASLLAALLLVFGCFSIMPSAPTAYAATNVNMQWPVNAPTQWKVVSGYNHWDHGCWNYNSAGLTCGNAYQLYGLDLERIDGNTVNAPVFSPVNGKVANVYPGNYPGTMLSILVAGTSNLRVSLVHLTNVTVSAGQPISAGMKLGNIIIGTSTIPTHLHFSLYTADLADSGSSRKPVPFINDSSGLYGGYDTHIMGCNSFVPAGTLNWSAKTYLPETSTTENQYTGNVTCGIGAPNPQTYIQFSIKMSGIGTGSGDNQHPIHTARSVAIQIRNSSNQNVATWSMTIFYTSSTGLYSGVASTTAVPYGTYLFEVKMSNALNTQGSYLVSAGTTTNEQTIQPVTGDIDGNNVKDIQDYNDLLSCYGNKFATCAFNPSADLNDDGQVDGTDYNLWLRG